MATLIERILAKVAPPDAHGCREWLGYITKNGTCRIEFGPGIQVNARRTLYEHRNGRLGKHDWLKRCPLIEACVEPDHQSRRVEGDSGRPSRRLSRPLTGWEHLHGGSARHGMRPEAAWTYERRTA